MKNLRMMIFFSTLSAGVLYILNILWLVISIGWNHDPVQHIFVLMEELIEEHLN